MIFVLAAPNALSLDPKENLVNYVVKHWDVEDGLPSNTIKQIFQTKDGYLWIGSMQGLVRFDGMRFTVFNKNNTPEMKNNQITSFAQTDDGSLWIGTSSGLLRYLDGRFTGYSTADGLKAQTVNCLLVAPDRSLWIGASSGIVRWTGGKFVSDIDTSAFVTLGLRTMAADRSGAIWIALGNAALRYQNGQFTRFGPEQGIGTTRVEKIVQDSEGRTLAVTQNGLYRLEGDRFVPFERNGSLSSPRISTTLVDRAGNLWIGSVGGLDRDYDGTMAPYSDQYGRKLGVVDALFEDREGCLWAGTSEGVYRLTDRRAHSLGEAEGLGGSLVDSIRQTSDGSLWIAAWGGGADRFLNGKVEHYRVGAPFSHETETLIYEAPDGTMWFGNRGSAVDHLQGNSIKTYVYQSGVASSRPVTAMLADDDGSLLLGIDKRGLLCLRDDTITSVTEVAEVVSGTVWSLFRTHEGRLLMGTSMGIYERNADRSWKRIEFPTLQEPVVARQFLEQADGSFWIATEGDGLVRWKGNEAHAYTTRQGMIDDILNGVLEDDEGNLWVNSARGVARIRPQDLDAIDKGVSPTVDPMIFGRGDGLLSASASGIGTPAAFRLTDGRLMFATDRGAAVIDPSQLLVNTEPPDVVVEDVLADEKTIAGGKSIEIAPGDGKLEFRYTALSLIAPERLRFRYQLEGSDAHWVEAGRERRATYTHLAPGRYTFRVMACNSDGVWSQSAAAVGVTLLPHFYQTLAFRIASVLALAGLVAFLVWRRLRQMNKRQAALALANIKLDHRVQERTAELSRSNEELRQRELLFRLIFEHAPVGVSWRRADVGPNYHFNSTFRRTLDLPMDALPDYSTIDAMLDPADAPRQAEMRARIESGQDDSYTIEQRYSRQNGETVWTMLSVAVIRDAGGRIIQEIGILEDVTARKKAERELAVTYHNLVDVSRQAGMAEVATNVLHNVGNVLNSVNISASLVSDNVRNSRSAGLAKVVALLREHDADLGAFFASDPRAKKLPAYLAELWDHIQSDQAATAKELDSLRANVDHIKEIVALQQSYASVSGLKELVDVQALVEDSLRMNLGALNRHHVEVVREFSPVPQICAEKHKILQILVNLVRNAKYACDATGSDNRLLTVRVANGDGRVKISVGDNGVGIPPENLTRIFSHGFTTKKDGHGFGLHSSALAAKEMGGSLAAKSDGPGKGALFTLELPAQTSEARS